MAATRSVQWMTALADLPQYSAARVSAQPDTNGSWFTGTITYTRCARGDARSALPARVSGNEASPGRALVRRLASATFYERSIGERATCVGYSPFVLETHVRLAGRNVEAVGAGAKR